MYLLQETTEKQLHIKDYNFIRQRSGHYFVLKQDILISLHLGFSVLVLLH